LYQIPDQQFVNLYWFRHDKFYNETFQKLFKSRYGYDLGVPLNWRAYEDIAQFWSTTKIDGLRVFGHTDYGKPSASLGWRFTDAWLSIAGAADTGIPNGDPVDEWGVRTSTADLIPRGSSITRGGGTNSPAAVYALEKYLSWFQYAPPEAKAEWDWTINGPQGSRGDIMQDPFHYVTWLSADSYIERGSPVLDVAGNPLWRVAPNPVGKYWREGMKVGYQDAGSWTIPRNTVGERRKLAWLWAQFCVSKSVALRKFLKGGTPFRNSVLQTDFVRDRQEKWGGLIEFLRSDQRKAWTDTGPNIPHYPALSSVWANQIGYASVGIQTAQETLDNIAGLMDSLMERMRLPAFSPVLNSPKSAEYWLDYPGAPVPEQDEIPARTMPYDVIAKCWAQLETGVNAGLDVECCAMRSVRGLPQGKDVCKDYQDPE
jgi:glycerol transport system substrate-binding protein